MKAKWIGAGAKAAFMAAVLAVACGEGHAIFDVDVFSFLKSGADTLHYTVPIVTTATVQNTPIKMDLVAGFGKSVVDTVTITAGGNLVNNTGSGTVTFRLFFAADSASTYSGTPVLTAGGSVSGPGTTPIGGQATLIADTLFSRQVLWVGVQARVMVSAGPPPPPVDGKVQVTALRLRIVLKPKLF